MSTAIQEPPVVGEEPTAEELELVAWGEEAQRRSMDFVRESLRQMVTLATALLAGSAALFSQPTLPLWAKASVAVLLMASLAAALWGAMPREVTLDTTSPDDVRAVRAGAAAARMAALRASSLSLLAAFAVAFIGFIVAAF